MRCNKPPTGTTWLLQDFESFEMSSSNTPPLIRGYEVVIGLETHAQLSTQSKNFQRLKHPVWRRTNTQCFAG